MAIFAVSFLPQLAAGKSAAPTARRGRRDDKGGLGFPVARLAFVVWLDGEAQVGDEGDDGLFGYPVGIECDRHLALGIG